MLACLQRPAAAGRAVLGAAARSERVLRGVLSASKRSKSDSVRTSPSSKAGLGARVWRPRPLPLPFLLE